MELLRHGPYPRPPECLRRQLDWIEHRVDLALDLHILVLLIAQCGQQCVHISSWFWVGFNSLRTHCRTAPQDAPQESVCSDSKGSATEDVVGGGGCKRDFRLKATLEG